MAKDIRMVFVGCGGCLTISFGPVLPFVEGLRVVAAVDDSDEALATARRDYGIGAGYHDLEECLERERPDAALIAAPVYHHRDLAVACARRGVHVLLEKPMARSVSECDQIIEAHERAGTVLMVGFMKRFNRSMLKAADLIARGEIGQVMGVRHCWEWGGNESARFAPLWRGEPRTRGGQWQDHGSHSVDLATWWAGPVRSVMGVFDITEPYWEVENEYNVICTHEGGARSVHLSTHLLHLENREEYLIFGETGTIELGYADGSFQNSKPYTFYLHRYGRVRENHRLTVDTNWLEDGRRHGQYKVELEHFVECVRTGARPRTDGRSGRAAIEVINAAYLSAQERRTVDLPLAHEPDFDAFFRGLPRRLPPRYRGG